MGLYENENRNYYPQTVEGTEWHCDFLWSTHRGCPYDCVYCSSKRLNIRFGGNPSEIRNLKGEWEQLSLGNIIKRKYFGDKGICVNPYCDIFTLQKNDINQIIGCY